MNASDTTPERKGGARAEATLSPRRLLFRVAAVLLGLSPLVLLEGGLRLFDLGRPLDTPDPFVGFNRTFPLFERQGAVYRTTRAHAPFIQLQEFPAEKPRNGYRIFCFGGSTVYGHPYLGDTAFPKWLELELAATDPTRAWQAVNCGGVSYASYRIVPLVQEALRHQPDLVILSTGHNEFLEDRTYRALKSRAAWWAWLQGRINSLHTVAWVRGWWSHGRSTTHQVDAGPATGDGFSPTVDTRLNSASGYAAYRRDREWHERVVAQFDESVRRIVAACQAARVPILLVRMGSNLRDCPPFKSEHRAGLAPEREADWQAAVDLAAECEKADPERALRYYREAEAIDGEYALLHYRMARLLDRLGRAAEALAHFQKARDEDICPLRILGALERCLQQIAAETGVPLVDTAALVAARSPEGIPGNDWFVDHVHPNIGGHQLIARALADQMRAGGWVQAGAAWPEDARRETYARHLAALGPAYFADGRRRVEWLENWAQRERLAGEAFPADPRGYARLGFRRIDLGEDEGAWEVLDEALKRDAGLAEMIRRHARELEAEGRADRAAALRSRVEQ
ncbi:MAG: hypothetical protein HZC55_09405 [Verrucomicrobia bacterium]|nr:hypothetical protein [Verrucomicrobiota bacterium]